MTWQAMEHVQDHAREWRLTTGELCVALAVARKASKHGADAYPGPATIAQWACVTPQSAKKLVRRLREKGVLIPVGISELGTQTYQIAGMGNHGSPGGTTVPGEPVSPGNGNAVGGEPRFPRPGNDGSPNSVLENANRERPQARAGARGASLSVDIAGRLQRAIDGIVQGSTGRPPTAAAVAAVIDRYGLTDHEAATCAAEARVVVQSADEAHDIASLFEKKARDLRSSTRAAA